jgi:hypothetical protein
LLVGAEKETVADPDAELLAVTDVGESGAVAGVTAFEAAEAEEVKRPLLAVALKV